MISKCFNYETDAARALAKGDNVLRVSYHHPFMRANIYIYIKKKWKPITPYFNTKLLPPPKLTSLVYKKLHSHQAGSIN